MNRKIFALLLVLVLCLSFSACGIVGQAAEPVPEGFTETQYETMELYDGGGDVTFYPLFTSFPANSNIVCFVYNNLPSDLLLKAGVTHIETEIGGKWYEIPCQFEYEEPAANARTTIPRGSVFGCNLSADLGEYVNRAGHYRVIRPLYKEDSVLCCEFYITEDESKTDYINSLPESPFVLTEGCLDYEVSTKCCLGALGDQQFSYTITNLTDGVITTGEGIFLEILSDGKWCLTPLDGADAMAYTPDPGKSLDFTAYLRTSWNYITPNSRIELDWPEDAEFRIVKDVTTADGSRIFCASEPFRLEMAE